MDDKVKALQILDETIAKNIRHQDYARVTQLASDYFDIFNAENLAKHLRRIMKREDEDLFKQRCDIFVSTIPASVANLDAMFDKPLRSNRIYSSIDHPSIDARNEIVERMRTFYQGESQSGVDAYLAARWKSLNMYDPNAFIAVEFKDFDPVREKAYPFPLEYSSAQAIRYEYVNGVLQWAVMQETIQYLVNKETKKTTAGSKYTMYIDNWAIVLTQVDKDKRLTLVEGAQFHEVLDEKGKVHSVYIMEEFETKAKGVPLFRVGYKSDPVTKGRTCVSNIHAALTFFKKELKTGSEFDLTMTLHVFPHRVQYGKACEGDKKGGKPCVGGRTPDGHVCKVCNGASMLPISTSTAEITYVKPPLKPTDPTIDLSKAFIYITPPVDFVKFQEDYLDRLTVKAKAAVFAAESVQTKTVEKSATEMDYSWDNVYDTFYPFAQKYSYAWMFIVKKIAVYTDNDSENLKLYHQFPKDFKLKGLGELLTEAKLAADSGLSQHVINALNNDVVEVLYSDDQDTLTKLKVKSKFQPFNGKTTGEIQSLFISGDILPYYRTLYIYFDIIFMDIDNELGDKFYLMPYNKQKEEIKARVDALTAEADKIKAKKLTDFLSQQQNPAAA